MAKANIAVFVPVGKRTELILMPRRRSCSRSFSCRLMRIRSATNYAAKFISGVLCQPKSRHARDSTGNRRWKMHRFCCPVFFMSNGTFGVPGVPPDLIEPRCHRPSLQRRPQVKYLRKPHPNALPRCQARPMAAKPFWPATASGDGQALLQLLGPAGNYRRRWR